MEGERIIKINILPQSDWIGLYLKKKKNKKDCVSLMTMWPKCAILKIMDLYKGKFKCFSVVFKEPNSSKKVILIEYIYIKFNHFVHAFSSLRNQLRDI